MNIHAIYKIFQNHFRPARMRKFADTFHIKNNHQIIDLGGCESNWACIEEKPKVLAINIDFDEEIIENVEIKRMDARNLTLPCNCMDIAFSNSVIEHVGEWEDQQAFAEEARRIAPNYYIQTPNRWFFIEPHFLCPFIHFLPKNLYRRMLPFFSVWYWITRPSREKVDAMFEEIRLLSKAEMKELFPDAKIIEEKFLFFFAKSFIACRKSTSS